MTASDEVSGWPEATVERVKDALFVEFHRTGQLGDMARAALSVLPDPTADTVLLDKVRDRDAMARTLRDAGHSWRTDMAAPDQSVADAYWLHLADGIAALLAGGDR